MNVNGIDHDTLAETLRDEVTAVTGAGDSDAPCGAIVLYVLTEPLIIPGYVTVPAGVYTRSIEGGAVHVHHYANEAEGMRAVVSVAHDDARSEQDNRDAEDERETASERAQDAWLDAQEARDAELYG